MDPWIQIATEHARCANPRHAYPLRWGESQGHALHLRRISDTLDETVKRSKVMFKKIYPDAKWSESDYRWTFPSGYQFSFGHCKDPDDWGGYQSNSYSHIAFDEATQFTYEQFEQISSRLRSKDPVLAGDPELGLAGMLRTRLASNPNMGSGGHAFTMKGNPFWLRERFVDPAPLGNTVLYHYVEMSDGTRVKRTRLFMPANLWHNPDKNFVRRYEEELQDKPHHIRQALLYGNWYITANSYFAGIWNERIHTCERYKVPSDWPRFRSMDWGFKLPGCILWFAMDDDGNMFVIRELKFQGKNPEEVSAFVKDIEIEMGVWDKRANRSLITGPADTQLWEQRSGAKQMVEIFAEKGIMWTQANKSAGTRRDNAQRVYKRLADHGKETMVPGLVIFKDCPYLIKTLPALQSKEGTPEEPEDGGDDHGTDALFYGVQFASRGRKGIPRIREKDDWDEEDRRIEQNRGRHGYGAY